MPGNDGLNTLASLCNKESISNEVSSPHTKPTLSRKNTPSSQNELGAQARANMFQTLQGIDPSMVSLFNSFGGQNNSQQMQSLLAAQLMESQRNSFQQPSYFLPNQPQMTNLIAQNLSSNGSYPTSYDSMTMNALLLATQQGKLQNQNQKHDRGKTICFPRCSVRCFFPLSDVKVQPFLNNGVHKMSFLCLRACDMCF